ncbi:MAG: protein kinase [Planctomycetota bacterium]
MDLSPLHELEEKVEAILDLPEAEHAAAFDKLRQEHPAHAELLKRWERAARALGAEDRILEAVVAAAGRNVLEEIPATIGDYEPVQVLGEGGMGTVYLAEQRGSLRRQVAIKVVKLGMDSNAVLRRFAVERQALAMMNHDNIARVFDAGHTERGQPFFVMELVHGRPLSSYCEAQRASVTDRIELMIQVCAGVQHAHDAGVVHRDLKPSNLLVSEDQGRPVIKIIDFGLARATDHRRFAATIYTEHGQIIGTPEYMSPEQTELSSASIDTRTDVFSLGVILYELLTGALPFGQPVPGEKKLREMQRRVCQDDPPAPSSRIRALDNGLPNIASGRRTSAQGLWRELRGPLDWVVMKAMEKEPARRYASASALREDLLRFLAGEPVVAGRTPQWRKAGKWVRRHRARLIPAVGLILAVVAIAFGMASRGQLSDERQANQLLPIIERHLERQEFAAALALVKEVRKALGDDPRAMDLLAQAATKVSIRTVPEGASVQCKAYAHPDAPWQHLGTSPLQEQHIARGYYRFRLSKAGYATIDFAEDASRLRDADYTMFEEGRIATEMVWASPRQLLVRTIGGTLEEVPSPGYFIDRYEVSNADYQRFVDRGGYREARYWQEEFQDNGQVLSRQEAMRRFVDRTGKLGPATWANGRFPSGKGNFPVSGISFYEAAAYARFRGKSLPTVSHWCAAAGLRQGPHIVPFSNIDSGELAAVGSHVGMSPFGTFDMAGNVKEWCVNPTSNGLRHILGGSWGDADYMFVHDALREPFDRAEVNGVRCMQYMPGVEPAPKLLGVLERAVGRDYSKETPCSTDEFAVIRRNYDYDSNPLAARVEAVEEKADWRREEVTVTPAYGQERLPIYVHLPRCAEPPFASVVYFPGAAAARRTSSQRLQTQVFGFLVRHGVAVVCPVIDGTYERSNREGPKGPIATKEIMIRRIKDVRRTVDYVLTRPDLQGETLGYYGFSWGVMHGPQILAVEPRLKVALLVAGGMPGHDYPPEVDMKNFVTRVRTPVLMVNGTLDTLFDPRTRQRPLYDWLATPVEHKRYRCFDGGGHSIHHRKQDEVEAEIIAWLARYQPPK